MSWENIVDQYLPPPGDEGGEGKDDDPSLLVGDAADDDEDDADFVPESLRGFFQAANETLQAHTRELFEMDDSNNSNAGDSSSNVMGNQEVDLGAELPVDMSAVGDVLPKPFVSPEPEMSFISPGLNNPAADLSDSQVKRIAMEGASPGDVVMPRSNPQKNLLSEMDQEVFVEEEDPLPPPPQQQEQQPTQSKKDTTSKSANSDKKPTSKAVPSKAKKSNTPSSPSGKTGFFGGRKGAKVAPDNTAAAAPASSPATKKKTSPNPSSSITSRLFQGTSSSRAKHSKSTATSPIPSGFNSKASKQHEISPKPSTSSQPAAPVVATGGSSQTSTPNPPASILSPEPTIQSPPSTKRNTTTDTSSRLFQPTSASDARKQKQKHAERNTNSQSNTAAENPKRDTATTRQESKAPPLGTKPKTAAPENKTPIAVSATEAIDSSAIPKESTSSGQSKPQVATTSSQTSKSTKPMVSSAAAKVVPSRLFQSTSSSQAKQQSDTKEIVSAPPADESSKVHTRSHWSVSLAKSKGASQSYVPPTAQAKPKRNATEDQPPSKVMPPPPSRTKQENAAATRSPPPSSRLLKGTASSASKSKPRQHGAEVTSPPVAPAMEQLMAEELSRRDSPPISQPPTPMETPREPISMAGSTKPGFQAPTPAAVTGVTQPKSSSTEKPKPAVSRTGAAPAPPPPAPQHRAAPGGTTEESLLDALKQWGTAAKTKLTTATVDESQMPPPQQVKQVSHATAPPPLPPPLPSQAAKQSGTNGSADKVAPPPPPKQKLPAFMAPTASAQGKSSSSRTTRMYRMRPGTLDINVSKPSKTSNGAHNTRSRLVKGATANKAKRGTYRQPSDKEMTKKKSPSTSIPRTSTGNRLFKGTASSQARVAKPSSASKPKPPPPSKVPSRLLQGTEATAVRVAISPRSTNKKSTQVEASEVQVRALSEEKRKKEKEERERIRLVKEQRKRRLIENSKKETSSQEKARERRARAEKIEQEHLEKLKAKIAQKQNRRSSYDLKQLHKVNLRPSPTTRTQRPPPTVPVGPHFATDARAAKAPGIHEAGATKNAPPLARSDDVLRMVLRAESSAPPVNRGRPSLTIPEGPKFATSARLGDKAGTQKDNPEEAKVQGWGSHLRKPEAPSAQPPKGPNKLTVPVTPKFHKTRKRELTKSTAEKEKELMEFYKTHPFKARPVKMHDSSPAVRPPRSERRLTTTEPFKLRTDNRAQVYPERDATQTNELKSFRARPMPDFSGSQTIPITGRTPDSEKRLTQAQPFHFYTDERAAVSTPQRVVVEEEKPDLFKARPMPDFAKSSPTVHERDPTRLLKFKPTNAEQEKEEEKPKQFKALPMPDFKFSQPLQMSPPVKKSRPQASKSPGNQPSPSPAHVAPPSKLFKARPMPNFKFSQQVQVTPPVKARTPRTKASPDKHPSPLPPSSEPPQTFKAKPMPDFSRPLHEVSPRNPLRLRTSQESMLRLGSPEDDLAKPLFKARPAPDFSKPALPVKDRNPAKLKTPERIQQAKKLVVKDGQEQTPVKATSFKARSPPDFNRVKIPVRDRKPPTPIKSPPQKPEAAHGSKSGTEKAFSAASIRRRLAATKPKPKSSEKGRPASGGAARASQRGTPTLVGTSKQGSKHAVPASAEAKLKEVETVAREAREETQAQTQPAKNAKRGELGREEKLQELRKATAGWGRGTHGTPAPYHTQPDHGVAQLIADDDSERSRHEDALRIAQEVEKAAQDELSLRGHASVDDEGYIEGAADDPINTVFTFTGRRK